MDITRTLIGLHMSAASSRVRDGALALFGAAPAQRILMHSVAGREGSADLRTPGRWMVSEYRTHLGSTALNVLRHNDRALLVVPETAVQRAGVDVPWRRSRPAANQF